MTAEQVFSVVSAVAAAGWLALVLLPRRRVVTDLIAGVAVPALLATAYAAILVVHWGNRQGGFTSLGDIARLFSNPWLLLAGWIHYLAFDLLIGSWEARDARARGLPYFLLLPCLALTFMFGPAGWLLYLGVRLTPRLPAGAGAP